MRQSPQWRIILANSLGPKLTPALAALLSLAPLTEPRENPQNKDLFSNWRIKVNSHNALLTTRNVTSAGILIFTSLVFYTTLDAKAYAVNDRVYSEIIALAGDEKDKDKEAAVNAIKIEREKPISEAERTKLKEYLANFKNSKKLDDRAKLNQNFGTAFVVSGITLTLLATTLGAVESSQETVKKWTKFAIAGLGAGAVSAQSLSLAFPVNRRAGDYASLLGQVESLEYQSDQAKNAGQLEDVKTQYAKLIVDVAKVEFPNPPPK